MANVKNINELSKNFNTPFLQQNIDGDEVNVFKILKALATEFTPDNAQPFKNVLLVGIQHILGTTIEMLSVMKTLGLSEAIIGGKNYSTHQASAYEIEKMGFEYVANQPQSSYGTFNAIMDSVTQEIWSKAFQKITTKQFDLMIILDDGADLLLSTPNKLLRGNLKNKPYAVIGIEQTNGGANRTSFRNLDFPVINVAGSYFKQQLEYPAVADLVKAKTMDLINSVVLKHLNKAPKIGIVGFGSLGQALVKAFSETAFPISTYDQDPHKCPIQKEVKRYFKLHALVQDSDIIISCVGEDVMKGNSSLLTLLNTTRKKWLISAGSKDNDFNTLLIQIQNDAKQSGTIPEPLKNILYRNHKGIYIEVLKGGFPVNFTNQKHSISPKNIWPTRAGLLLACLQATELYAKEKKLIQNTAPILPFSEKAQMSIIQKHEKIS